MTINDISISSYYQRLRNNPRIQFGTECETEQTVRNSMGNIEDMKYTEIIVMQNLMDKTKELSKPVIVILAHKNKLI